MSVARRALDCRDVTLLTERAVWRAKSQTLFVADVHLGKAATFRALGHPAPAGTTRENLERLTALIVSRGARRLVFLGDLFHAREAHGAEIVKALRTWREIHHDIEMILVRGNHDRRAGDPAPNLRIETIAEPYEIDGLEARHVPREADEALQSEGATVLAGHIHPATRLYGRGHDLLRFPCFALQGRQIILPAFGEFTGGASFRRESWMRACAVTDAGLILIGGN